MGIFSRVFRASVENPSVPLSQAAAMLASAWASTSTDSGRTVTPQTAALVNAVYACVAIKANTLAARPLHFYERLERGKRRAAELPAEQLVAIRPNPLMSPFKLRQTMMAHALLWGRTVAEIERDNAGRPIGIWPILPSLATSRMSADGRGRIWTVQLPDGGTTVLDDSQVLHISALHLFRIWDGESPVMLGRQSIGVALAAEEFAARFYAQGTTLSGAVETDQALDDEQYRRLRTQIEERHTGLSHAHRVLILEAGLKWHQMGVSPEQAQYLESRRFQVAEIARLFGVPPHMIGETDKSTSWGTGIEQQTIGFVVYSMDPWFTEFEQEFSYKLLAEDERRRYFCEHSLASLLRGDLKTRYEAYAIGRQWGWLSANDIREKENENPYPGGDEYLIPLNMMPASQALGVRRLFADGDIDGHLHGIAERVFSDVCTRLERLAAHGRKPVRAETVAEIFSQAATVIGECHMRFDPAAGSSDPAARGERIGRMLAALWPEADARTLAQEAVRLWRQTDDEQDAETLLRD